VSGAEQFFFTYVSVIVSYDMSIPEKLIIVDQIGTVYGIGALGG
jgi:hypothetical protein